MFQNLRKGSSIYILHKDGNPELKKGTVVNVTPPMPKYTYQPMLGQPQEMVVDITVKVDNQDMNYQKIPANAEIAEFGLNGVILSDSREAMNMEVISLKNRSIEIVSSVDFHKGVIVACDKILEDLNPEFAERQAQQNEINALREQMQELMKMNRDLLSKLGSDHKK